MLKGLIFLFMIYSFVDFIYLKNKWSKNRYVSINYFYRNYYNLEDVDKIDEQTYKKIIALDRSTPLERGKGHPVIFFYEGNPDIAIDMKHPAVFETDGVKEYKGNGADIFIIVSKKTFFLSPDFFKRLLPGYHGFKKIDETGGHIFFQSE
ncbi:MAG: hypothetical protein KF862_15460 [Chitinophagaceae bacterium]|nr:hypothetical protein [Chitinophagaceae bacterium]